MSWLCLSFFSRPHHLVSSTSLQTDLICLEPREVKGTATEGQSRAEQRKPHGLLCFQGLLGAEEGWLCLSKEGRKSKSELIASATHPALRIW